MVITGWLVMAALVMVAVLIALSYNRFAAQRAAVETSWANVGTELQRRHDLVPNLVQVVGGYATHERETLEAVVAARTAAMTEPGAARSQVGEREQSLTSALVGLLAVVERYPDLKADQSFLELQRELVSTEDRLQAARRLYNNNVMGYNRRLQTVPANLVGRAFGFAPATWFPGEPAVSATPAVRF